MNAETQRRGSVFAAIVFAGVLAGCSSNVRLDPVTIPAPNVNQIDMTVGVRMPEEFDEFVHEETVLGRDEWTIDLGDSNAILLSDLFGYMFSDTKVVGPDDDAAALGLDALIEPSIDAFEFSVPEQTKTQAFAVWIRYRLKVYDRRGVLVADWPVSAYGKSLTTTLGGDEALQRAAILAMRDAAALIIMRFDDETMIGSLADPATQLPAVEDKDDAKATAQNTALGGSNNE